MGGELVLLKHDDSAGPGWLLDRCVDRVGFFRVILVRSRSDLPPPNECNGVVFTSLSLDPAAIAARDPLVREEVVFVRTLVGLGVPYLGIDGGAQLLARAVLGQVGPDRHEAMGVRPIVVPDEARADPLFGPEAGQAHPVVWWPTHRIELPDRATVLAGSRSSPECFRVGEWAYGLLPHVEATPLMFSGWVDQIGSPVPHRAELEASVEAAGESQRALAYRLMNRFIDRASCFCHDVPVVR
jgi:GMP synthase-like glutamine amidotransferase